MKTIKTNTVLKSFKGEPLKNGNEEVTIGMVVSTILGGKVSNPTLGWVLGKKFATEKEVDLKAEEVVFLKKEIESENHSYTALATGQIIEILEAKDEEKKK